MMRRVEDQYQMGLIAPHEQVVLGHFRRNVAAVVGVDSLWGLGLPFALSWVLVPAYLNLLDAPKVVIGITSAFGAVFVPLQLLAIRLIEGRNRKKKVWLTLSVSALSYVVFGVVGFLLPAEARLLRMVLFVVTMAVFFATIALGWTVYWAMITDNCPVRRRGRLLGWRATGMGAAGLAAAPFAQWVYVRLAPEAAFHLSMMIAGGCFLLASACVLLMRDHVEPGRQRRQAKLARVSVVHQTRILLRRLWRTPNYRMFIFFVAVLAAAFSVGPFIVTYSRDVVGSPAGSERFFNLAFLAAYILTGLVVGRVADAWGYRFVAVILAAVGFVTFVLAQAAGTMSTTLLAYLSYSCTLITMPMIVCNMSAELMPRMDPTSLIAGGNILTLPAALLTPVICGRIIDMFRSTGHVWDGHTVVFTIAAALAVVAGLGLALLVQEPRSGRVYIIKALPRV